MYLTWWEGREAIRTNRAFALPVVHYAENIYCSGAGAFIALALDGESAARDANGGKYAQQKLNCNIIMLEKWKHRRVYSGTKATGQWLNAW